MEKATKTNHVFSNGSESSFEHTLSAIANELSLRYQGKELDSVKFREEENDLARNGLYVTGFSLLFTAYYLHAKGKLLETSCTDGGHVVTFRCRRGAHGKAMKMLRSFDGLSVEELFARLHEEKPVFFPPNSREGV